MAHAQSGTWKISATSGPVGSDVEVSGNVGESCAAQDQGAVALLFQRGPGQGQPNEWINVPLASNGSWSANFVIPPFFGGEAMTRGSSGANVTPGTWQFGVPRGCGVADTFVSFQVTSIVPVPSRFVGLAPSPAGGGYWLAQANGGVFSYGDAPFLGSLPGMHVVPAEPITGIAASPYDGGYWLVGADGGVFAFGHAVFFGSLPAIGVVPHGIIVGIVPTKDGGGYWLVGADGGVFAFGDADFHGNASGSGALATVALLATPTGGGYLLPDALGIAAPAFGDATAQQGSPIPLVSLLSGGAITLDGNGCWEVGTDGGVFSFGNAVFHGSLPGEHVQPRAPIVGMARTPDDRGYWLVGADGGVFAFGDAGFYGSSAGSGLAW